MAASPKTRRRASVLFTALCVLLTLVVGALLLVLREMNHRTLNRQLVLAIQDKDYKLALTLLDKGASGDAREKEGPPVTVASVFKALLHPGGRTTAADIGNPSALNLIYNDGLFAAPPPATVETLAVRLVAIGSPIEDQGKSGYETPLGYAVRLDQHRAVAAMLRAGVPTEIGPQSSLLAACDLQDGQLLLEHGADPNRQDEAGRFPLANPNSQLVELLLAHGAHVNAQNKAGDTPLIQACMDAHKGNATVQALLDANADVNLTDNDGCNAAMFASQSDNIDLLNLLAKAGADFTVKSKVGNALNLAAHTNASGSIVWLLKHGVDAKVLDNESRSCIATAARFDSVVGLKALMQAGSPYRVRDRYGNTILHFAAHNANESVAIWALGLDLDVNARNLRGQSVAHVAARLGKLQLLKAIQAHGGDINLQDSYGDTPLVVACEDRNAATADWLLSNGARPGVKDKGGRNALDILIERLRYSVPDGSRDDLAWRKVEERLRQKGVTETKNLSISSMGF